MYEIALRAGSTSDYYFWSNEPTITDTSYIVCYENSGGGTVVVGSRTPNDWGLYDMGSNVTQWFLDDAVDENMASRPDAFTPAWAEGTNRRFRGGNWGTSSSSSGSAYKFFRASHRSSNAASNGSTARGFRIAMIRR